MKTLITFLLLAITSVYSQSALVQEQRQNIVGTWTIDNQATNKWIFNADNTCKWQLNGSTLKNFTYLISSEFSSNGVEHTFLKLVNSTETYEYEINSIHNNKMALETTEPKLSYTYFTKL